MNKISSYYFKKASDYADKHKNENYWRHTKYKDLLNKAKYYGSYDIEKSSKLLNSFLEIMKHHEELEQDLISSQTMDVFNPYDELDTLYIGRKATNMEMYVNKYFGDVTLFNQTKDYYILYKQGVSLEELIDKFDKSGKADNIIRSIELMENRMKIIEKKERGEFVPISEFNFSKRGKYHEWVPKNKLNEGNNIKYWSYNKDTKKYDKATTRSTISSINAKITSVKNVSKVTKVGWKKK